MLIWSIKLNNGIEVLSKAHAGLKSDGSQKASLRHDLELNPYTLSIYVAPFSLYSAVWYLFATLRRVSLTSTA